MAVILLVSGLCFVPKVQAYGTSTAVYYVSPNGSDSAAGTKAAPFATIKKAYTTMKSKSDGGTIVIMGDVESSNDEAWSTGSSAVSSHSKLLTITGKDPVTGEIYDGAILRYNSTSIKGPTQIDNVIMRPVRNSCFINTKGIPLIIGENVTNENFPIYFHDGIGEYANGVAVSSTDTTMNGGDVGAVYIGGGYPDKITEGVTGDCIFTMNGGMLGKITIGFDKYLTTHTTGLLGGNVIITINGGSVGNITTSNVNDGTVEGFVAVIFNNNVLSPTSLPQAKEGVYEIHSNGHGIVSATDTAGYFTYVVDRGYECYVNGELNTDGSFNADEGVTEVRFKRSLEIDAATLEKAYAFGYDDGTFKPDEKLTRVQAIELILNATTDKSSVKNQYTSSYSDISKSDWYYDSVAYFEYINVLPKEWGDVLSPNNNITRGEFVYIADNLLSKSIESIKLLDFVDVDGKNPYYSNIMNAMGMGIITGYGDKTFRPDNTLSRAEAVTIINRYLSRIPNEDAEEVFDDTVGHWASNQITAASTELSENQWSVDTQGIGEAFIMPEGADSAEDYVKALYYQSEHLSGAAIRDGVDVIAEQMKKDILNTPNTQDIYGDKITGTTYKISPSGSDSWYMHILGNSAYKTYAGLTSIKTLKAGDAVLFERGGTYRGTISTVNGVVYGAYGTGNKPLLMQSKRNYADASLWVETAWENVWKCTQSLNNVGVIGYDHDLFDYSEASYNELYGDIYNMNTRGFTGPADMDVDLSFYSVLSGDVELYNSFNPDATAKIAANELYVYSTEGNPGKRFSSIEIGEKTDIFDGTPKNVIIDNLAMKFTGAHAVGFGNSENITVTNCVFSWLGGSVLTAPTATSSAVNYGNAVEIYGSCDGYYVENNWTYQIYDTGVTHQYSSGSVNIIQQNVYYTGNLIEYVHWGIEFYNAPGDANDPTKDYTRDVYDRYNVCRMGGYGWGSLTRFRTKSARLYCGASLSENYDQFTEYNIFDRCAGYLINLPANSTEVDDKNIYIQTIGCTLGFLKGTTVACSTDAYKNIAKYLGDQNAVVVVIDEN